MRPVPTLALLTTATLASVAADVSPTIARNGTVETLAVGSLCPTPEYHFDFPGNDVRNLLATQEQCCELCYQLPFCGAYTWSNYQGGSCYIKSYKSYSNWQGANADGSAKVLSVEMYRCAPLTKDQDFDGGDFYNAPAPHPQSCCQMCANSRMCMAFSWSDFNGGTCWLKDEDAKPVYRPGVTSGRRYIQN